MKLQTPSRNLAAWLLILVLILACVPSSMVAQVPTLDPLAVNTYIAQTANAASTRTASVPTITPTFTPPSTFTPEATYTAIGPYVFPTGTLPVVSQYWRVKHDQQLGIYNNRSRTAAPGWGYTNQTNEVVSLFIDPSVKSKTTRTHLNRLWEVFMDRLNNNEAKKLRYLKSDATALFDHTGFPELESKTMGGNIVMLDEISNGWGRVHTMSYGAPGNALEINYFTHPELVHKFVAVGWNDALDVTFLINPPPGDIYWPLVTDRPVWIPMDRLEPFPILPMTVTVAENQFIRSSPSFDTPESSSSVKAGTTIQIIDYQPSASDVWGRITNGGWIVLFQYKKGVPHYTTTWSMATVPPIPPVPEGK